MSAGRERTSERDGNGRGKSPMSSSSSSSSSLSKKGRSSSIQDGRKKSGRGKSQRRHRRTFLSIVLNAVRGRELIVELKNDTQFRGVVDVCANNMDIVMRDVIRRKPTVRPTRSESRYAHTHTYTDTAACHGYEHARSGDTIGNGIHTK